MLYLDNHATTPCDPRVVEAMLPWLTQNFGNPHSSSHDLGRAAGEVIEQSIEQIGSMLKVAAESVLITSGATESNNLAIDGVCRHPRQKRRHLVTTTIEHHAVLDVASRLEKDGFRVSRVGVHPQGHPMAGQVNLDELANVLDDDTALVSVIWANNEIGVIQPMRQIAELVHQHGSLLHSDATQAVGRIPVDLRAMDVDMASATAHKFYGPKGVGLLAMGGGEASRRIRLRPMIIGGGQQRNLRSGTLSPANVVAMCKAMQLAIEEQLETTKNQIRLRQILLKQLCDVIPELTVNGPVNDWQETVGERETGAEAVLFTGTELGHRLPGNLSVMLPGIEGAAWMAATTGVAFSSGSACSSVDAKPSHVLTALGLSDDMARQSVRFGIGKWNTETEIVSACKQLGAGYQRILGG